MDTFLVAELVDILHIARRHDDLSATEAAISVCGVSQLPTLKPPQNPLATGAKVETEFGF